MLRPDIPRRAVRNPAVTSGELRSNPTVNERIFPVLLLLEPFYERDQDMILDLGVLFQILLTVVEVHEDVIHAVGHECGVVSENDVFQLCQFVFHFVVMFAGEDADVVHGVTFSL